MKPPPGMSISPRSRLWCLTHDCWDGDCGVLGQHEVEPRHLVTFEGSAFRMAARPSHPWLRNALPHDHFPEPHPTVPTMDLSEHPMEWDDQWQRMAERAMGERPPLCLERGYHRRFSHATSCADCGNPLLDLNPPEDGDA